jgi:hypothetical protein
VTNHEVSPGAGTSDMQDPMWDSRWGWQAMAHIQAHECPQVRGRELQLVIPRATDLPNWSLRLGSVMSLVRGVSVVVGRLKVMDVVICVRCGAYLSAAPCQLQDALRVWMVDSTLP